MAKPTDDQILEALREAGQTMTYVVANILRRKFYPLSTAFVLRRLKALEAAGKVEQMPSDYAIQYCWRARATGQDSEAGDA